MADKSKDIVTREVLEKASKDVLQEVSEHLYNYVPYTDEEIAEIFDLDEVTAKSLSKVINDEYIAKNKVFSNEHTVELLNQTLADANKFSPSANLTLPFIFEIMFSVASNIVINSASAFG